MKTRKTLKIFCLVMLLMMIAVPSKSSQPVFGAEAARDVWMVNGIDQRLVKVTADGNQAYAWPFTLPPYSLSDLAVSPDGNLLGACLFDSTAGQWAIGVANMAQATVIQLPLATPIGCSTTRASFNEDGTRLAYGVVHYLPGDLANPTIDPATSPVASLNVLDTATGTLVDSLEFTLEGLTNLFQAQIQQPPTAVLPIVVDYREGLVSYQLVPYAVGGTFVLTAEQWLVEVGISERVEKYNHAGLQILPVTGVSEVAWPDISNTYPVAQAPGPIPSYNVVGYTRHDDETRTVFTPANFAPERALVVQVEWVNDGRVLLIHLLGEQLPDVPNLPEYWVALGRDGSLREITEVEGFQVMGAAGGFVHLVTTYQGEGFGNPLTRLEYVTFAEGTSLETTTETIWEEPSESWIILWTSPAPIAADLTPFPAIAD